ncbi:MAG: rod shape-determining protein MreC [Armatimonadetes bacterium 55-13]|nr:rod shape-determining protein MreC [Armatimonadota bacterium]OJU64316.1 MAG: rod shape-determining protein MreC [Armatimonadetes bacterium 55-13]
MKKSNGRDFLVLLALCVIGVMLGRSQSTARAAGRSGTFDGIVKSAVRPPEILFTNIANGCSDFFTGIFSARSLTQENRQLKQLERLVNQYTETVDRLNREIDSLRAIVDLPAIGGRTKIAATVIGYAPTENRVTISAGSRQGITAGLAVVNGDGLIGVIQTVDATESQVSLISDPNRKIGAMVESRKPSPLGIIRGETTSTVILSLDANAPVQNGDLVSTSGFSKRVPRGVPIGRVNQVYDDPNTGTRRVEVFPNVALGSVREVVVLK